MSVEPDMSMQRKESDWHSALKTLGGGTLSVVLPVYNLAQTIEDNLSSVATVLDGGGFPYELIPVDDGSTDGSADAIRRFAVAFDAATPAGSRRSCRPVLLERNVGKGNALREGVHAASGDFVLLLDGDLDILPQSLPGFFDVQVRDNADIVIGSKRHPDSKVQYPWHRRIASRIYFAMVRLFIGLPITDTQTGMKLFRRKVLDDALARMLVKAYAFDLELLSIAYGRGAKVSEAPVEIRYGTKFGALRPQTVRDMMIDTMAVVYRLRILHYYAKVEVPPAMPRKMRVSVVIACPDDSWMLHECLEALAGQTFRDFEVIVLPDDDKSFKDDNSFKDFQGLKVIPTGKVRPAEKRNIGIAAAAGDVVAFIDDDAYPDRNWLENAIRYFAEPTIGGVGGPGVTPPGDGFLARAGGRVYENFFVSGGYRYRYLGGRVRLDVDDYPSCNLLVRTDLLRRIGGYRTDFWPGEDTLLCEAIVLGEHRRIVYDPWVLVYHHRRPLLLPHLRQLGRYGFHRGYFVKRFPATSCRFSYFVPTLFVLYLLALAAVWTWRAYAGGGSLGTWGMFATWPLFAYLILTGLSSFSFNPCMWLLTWLGIFLSHVTYGLRFMQGLLAGKAPCEFIGGDHAQGKRGKDHEG
ncbi:MAG: glycosyltransferase [Kiritimatiellae bacterium]|nr:glycosyltransferase [Kiritimatiellia bacterium]